jgi:diacylglycerol kinase (ATP)
MIATVLKKLEFSVDGLRATWTTEPSFRQWFALVLASDIAVIVWQPGAIWVALIVAFGFLLLAAELINTAVEAIVDKTTPEIHPLAKKAKDAGSAMTLITFLALCSLWAGAVLG